MTSCLNWNDQLDDVAAGGMASADFTSHLMSCAACHAELARRRNIVARIDAVAREWMNVPAPGIVATVSTAVLRHKTDRRQPWILWLSGAAIAASLALAFYASLQHANQTSTSATGRTIVRWQSPTAGLLRPTLSVLDVRSRGRLLDIPYLRPKT